MAVRFDASSDAYTRTGLGVAHTIMAWVYISVDTDAYQGFWGYDNGSQYFMGTNGTGTRLNFYNGSDNTGTDLTVGAWNHIAIVAAAGVTGARDVYLNGALDISATGDDITGGTLHFGKVSSGSNLNGRLEDVKVYSAALSQAEIQQEMQSKLPKRTANLFGFYPMLSAADGDIDYSGNGNNLTAAGTLTTEDGPPVGWSAAFRKLFLPAGGTLHTITPSGSITPSGALAKQVNKPFAGSVTPAGSLIRSIGKAFSGSITPAGTLSTLRSILLSLAGSITPAGSLTRQISKTFSGQITPAGALVKFISKTLSGILTPAGNLIASLLGGGGDPCVVTVSDSAQTSVTVSDSAQISVTVSDSPAS